MMKKMMMIENNLRAKKYADSFTHSSPFGPHSHVTSGQVSALACAPPTPTLPSPLSPRYRHAQLHTRTKTISFPLHVASFLGLHN